MWFNSLFIILLGSTGLATLSVNARNNIVQGVVGQMLRCLDPTTEVMQHTNDSLFTRKKKPPDRSWRKISKFPTIAFLFRWRQLSQREQEVKVRWTDVPHNPHQQMPLAPLYQSPRSVPKVPLAHFLWQSLYRVFGRQQPRRDSIRCRRWSICRYGTWSHVSASVVIKLREDRPRLHGISA
jgi:hypothetical protein